MGRACDNAVGRRRDPRRRSRGERDHERGLRAGERRPRSPAADDRDDDHPGRPRTRRGRAAPGRAARRHPDDHVRDRHGDVQAAPRPRRLAPAPRDHARRAAEHERLGPASDFIGLGAMTAPEALTDPELEEVSWDLSDLIGGAGDPQAAVDSLLDEAKRLGDAFAAAYAGKVAELDGPGLVAAMRELGEIEELAARAGTYAHLSFSVNTADPVRGALLQRVEEKGTSIETALLFFQLEWAALDDAKADELLAADGLDFARHHLATARRYRPHLLSEPEEKILTEKALSGRTAWVRLFEEQTAAIQVELADATEPVSLEVAMARLFSPDAAVRRDTAERVTAALQPGLRTRAYAFNTLLADKITDDRLRSYPHWLAARNLSNEASDESVQALIEAVRSRYELTRRWYRLKAKLLGIDRLADYDRMAAVTQDTEKIAWPEAKSIVLDAYSTFSDELGGIVGRFFDE